MDLHIPSNWVECTKEEFDDYLKDLNYHRSAWVNGEEYIQNGSNKTIGYHVRLIYVDNKHQFCDKYYLSKAEGDE